MWVFYFELSFKNFDKNCFKFFIPKSPMYHGIALLMLKAFGAHIPLICRELNSQLVKNYLLPHPLDHYLHTSSSTVAILEN